MSQDHKYIVNGINLTQVRNRNEVRVVKAMRVILGETSDFCGCRICTEDVYAATLNQIACHYVQVGAIILGTPQVSDSEVERLVEISVAKITETPNHGKAEA